MWPYYGGKGKLAPYYPAPVYDRIVEPFAGAANYSRLWHSRQVLLLDADPAVVAIWHYLQRTTAARIMELPVLQKGESVEDPPGLCPEERLLLRYYASPGKRSSSVVTSMGAGHGQDYGTVWNRGRHKLVERLEHCRHWEVRCASYEDAPDVDATWFVDPPYAGHGGVGGAIYAHTLGPLDYPVLADWVRNRRGQVIACDYGDATWLPFRPLRTYGTASGNHVGGKGGAVRQELVYLQGPQRLAGQLGTAKHRPGVPTTLYA